MRDPEMWPLAVFVRWNPTTQTILLKGKTHSHRGVFLWVTAAHKMWGQLEKNSSIPWTAGKKVSEAKGLFCYVIRRHCWGLSFIAIWYRRCWIFTVSRRNIFLCYDIFCWFNVKWLSRPLSYYIAHYRSGHVFTSMSNKVTMRLISTDINIFCFGFSVQTYIWAGKLLNWYYFNKLYPLCRWVEISEFSLSTISQISWGLITKAAKLD